MKKYYATVREEILSIIHTLENQWGYEVPNMAYLEEE